MKYVKLFIICFIVFLLCGCEGDITRNIRHAGFSLSNSSFVCDAILAENKDDTEYETIVFFDPGNSYMITNDSKIYEISLSQKYSDGQNCRLMESSIGIVSIFNNTIFRGTDNNLYYLKSSGKNERYSQVTIDDNNYELYRLLLDDASVIKVIKDDSTSNQYFVLRGDGRIFIYTVAQEEVKTDSNKSSYSRKKVYVIKGTKEAAFSSKITTPIRDFNYSYNSQASSYAITDNELFRSVALNSDDCSAYADIECEYEFKRDNALMDSWDYILAYNGNTLITTYGKVFTN